MSPSNPDDPEKVLILDPFDRDLSPEGEQIVLQRFKASHPRRETDIDELVLKKNRQATPRHLANWREYKTVLLTTHGGDRFILEQTGENDYSTYTDFGINSDMVLYTLDEEVYREHSRRLKEACKTYEVVRILFGSVIHDGGLRTAVDEACGESMAGAGEDFAQNCPRGNRASIGKFSNGARRGKYVTPGGFCRAHNCGGCNHNRWCRFCEEVDHKTQICCSPEGGEQTCVSEQRTYGYMYELASWPPRSELPSFSIQ